MRVMLDTHVLLWALNDDTTLSKKARAIIEDPDNWICYSIVSPWEIEIKRGKHPELFSYSAYDVHTYARTSGFEQLDVKLKHVYALESLEPGKKAKIHQDPFDRMLIAQAKAEGMILLTRDKKMEAYGEPNVVMV